MVTEIQPVPRGIGYPTKRDAVTIPGVDEGIKRIEAAFPDLVAVPWDGGILATLPDGKTEMLRTHDILEYEPGAGFKVNHKAREQALHAELWEKQQAEARAKWIAEAPKRQRDERRRRAYWNENQDWAQRTHAELVAGLAGVAAAVVRLHEPEPPAFPHLHWHCGHCGADVEFGQSDYDVGVEYRPWPCPTVTLIAEGAGVDVTPPAGFSDDEESEAYGDGGPYCEVENCWDPESDHGPAGCRSCTCKATYA